MGSEAEEDQKLGIRMMSSRFVVHSFEVLFSCQTREANGVILLNGEARQFVSDLTVDRDSNMF